MRVGLLVLVAAVAGWAADKPRFVKIPAGSAVLGCDEKEPCVKNFPRKEVKFDQPFWMTRTEVTVGQFLEFVNATGYRTEAEKAGEKKTWRNPGFKASHAQPVVWVSLPDARAYCEWAGGAVPNEAEWEYAARAGATTYHYWGEEIDARYLWYRQNTDGRPEPVATKKPNAWGLYDVEGNVWEWVEDGGSHSSITEKGWGSVRGGGWITCPEPYPPNKNGLRQRQIGLTVPFPIFERQNFQPDFRREDAGFRCVRRPR
ncbi:MAG: formylglycine-generating enzyme family protein [Bryobacteraceae bacterium]|nr:formylglycine-generating enzyme family protein [Bryobacteraceae bacterium]